MHWAAACFFSLTVVAFVLAMLPSWRRWQIWPERVGLAALKDGATELRHRYLTYTPASVGKYDMGQKALIWLMIVGIAAMMASGLVLMLRAMFGGGEIDAEIVRRNHPLWWKKLTSK